MVVVVRDLNDYHLGSCCNWQQKLRLSCTPCGSGNLSTGHCGNCHAAVIALTVLLLSDDALSLLHADAETEVSVHLGDACTVRDSERLTAQQRPLSFGIAGTYIQLMTACGQALGVSLKTTTVLCLVGSRTAIARPCPGSLLSKKYSIAVISIWWQT